MTAKQITSLWLQRRNICVSSLSRQIGAKSDAFVTVAIIYQSDGVFFIKKLSF
jgi:hypothetical protein